MGIYNRDYYRDGASSYSGSWGLEGLTPVVKFLIIANVVVFLLQIFVVREVRLTPLEILRKRRPDVDRRLTENQENDPEGLETLKKDYPELYKYLKEKGNDAALFPPQRVSIIQEWCELDTRKVIFGGQVWRLLTHAFCHDRLSLFHVLFNMICLYWFGGTLESMYGAREFTLFYLTAAVVSAVAFMGLDLYTGSTVPAVGASGAVMAVMMLYTMNFPYSTIRVFWLFPLEMRWVMVFYALFDLYPVLLALAGDQLYSGIGHAAHLGGLAFGFLYARYEWRLEAIGERLSLMRGKWKRRPRLRLAPETLPVPAEEVEMDRVDQLLQKIYESGQASLTEEERAILREASERVKNQQKSGG
jgi:membrane associated rhomboid family serine protease